MLHLVFIEHSSSQSELLGKIVDLKHSVKDSEGRDLIANAKIIENKSDEGLGQGCQKGVMLFFKNKQDLEAYHVHPEHEAVKELVFESIDVKTDLTVIDLQASDVEACLRTSP